MIKRYNGKKFSPVIAGMLLSACVAMFGIVFYSDDVVAGNKTGASGSKNTPNNSCSASTGTHTSTYCGIFGVSWRYYELDDSKISHLTTEVNRCKEEDTDGIYILAYELVDVKDGNVTNFHGEQVLGDPDKFVQVKEVNKAGGWKTYLGPGTVAGTENWEHVKSRWNYYKEAFDDDVPWESTTWFCGSEDTDPRTGIVKGNSSVSINGASGSRTGAEVGPASHVSADSQGTAKNKVFTVTVSTSQPQISGSIWHNMAYTNVSEGWSSVKQKAKKYKGITLDTFWDVADGDVDAGEYGYANEWNIPAKESTYSSGNVGTVTPTVKAGEKYCHTLTYEPVKFKFDNSSGVTDETGRAHTTACIQVNHVEKPTDPKDEFWATSSVWIPNAASESQLNGYDPGKHTSDRDAAVGLKVSTDNDTLQFSFSHLMSYDVADYNHNMWRSWNTCQTTNANGECVGGWDYYDTPTALTYELTGDTAQVTKNSEDEESQYTAGKTETDAEGNQSHSENKNIDVATYTYTITGIQPGETKKVCHKITYNPKYVVTPITEKLVWIPGTNTVQPDWVYGTPSGSGSEDSEACIEITRPKDPPGDCPDGNCPDGDSYGPKNGGDNNATIMYAGEQADVGWNVEAESVPTRRVTDYSAVSFVVRDDVKDTSTLKTLLSWRTQKLSPCDYFPGKATLISYNGATCAEFVGENLSTDENSRDGLAGATKKPFNASESETIAVPDDVGGKYCVSYGYKWGYWWGVVKGDNSDALTDDAASWTHVGDKDYWTNYSPACRTIAKKPSMAVWNGSLFSSGGVVSSTAPRHNDAQNGQPTKLNDNTAKTTYGSWAENLVVAGGNVNKFASSGAYGAGLPGLVEGNSWDMAWLTISNQCLINSNPACMVQGFTDGTLGNSDINYNSSYSTRLAAYLKNSEEERNDAEFSGIENATETTFYYYNPSGGTLKITGNVTLDQASKTSIYEMPQVVIYVEGDVKIAPNVTRLDAWIIATGNVNTCDGWESSKTQTQSQHYNENTTCDKSLQINGPVIAGSVTLNRTYGADNLTYGLGNSGKYTSGEVFNLSALTYLWSFAQAGRYNSSYTDVYARELAPRY